jgi:hypothetical protein
MSEPINLRLVPDDIEGTLADDEALATINEHWKAARAAYAAAIGALGEHYLRQLIVPPAKRSIGHSHMAEIRDQARVLAGHATKMADELDRAVSVYARRGGGPR